MERPLQVGDNVHVVWGICACTRVDIGVPGRITRIVHGDDSGMCGMCGAAARAVSLAHLLHPDGMTSWKPIPWLRRIPPAETLSEVALEEMLEVILHG